MLLLLVLFVCYYDKKQLSNTKLILTEAANRFEAGKKKLSELEKSAKDSETISKLRSYQDLEKSMESARNRHAQRQLTRLKS